MDFIREEEKDLKNIFSRFRRGDFRGNAGQAIKNSSYQLAKSIISKIGSLLFTIVLAGQIITVHLFGMKSQILSPELFGLYNLSLVTIILFGSFSDLGIRTALTTFVSKELSKKNKKGAKKYFLGLIKYKVYLILGSSLLLLSSSYFIANNYYNKPIFLALLAGGLYLPLIGLSGYLESAFISKNNFKTIMKKEILFQISRLILVPVISIYLLSLNLTPEVVITGIILTLAFSYFLSFVYLYFNSKKELKFLKKERENLTKRDKKKLKRFILPLTFTALSGMFFGYVDTLMLGHYVQSKFIAYYGASFALIGSISAIVGFIPGSALPLFSRLKNENLEKIFRKARSLTIFISVLAGIFTIVFSKYILLIYGSEYIVAKPILNMLSILIIILPMINLYGVYFTSREKTKLLAKLIIFSTVVNIVLNFAFINWGLLIGGEKYAVFGACLATIISRLVYLEGLIWSRRR